MKKFIVVVLIGVICLTLGGCATVEYYHSDNFDFTVTQGYKVYLEEDYLETKGYEVKEMKEFLFRFFALYGGKNLSKSEYEKDSVSHSYDQYDMRWVLNYTKENNQNVVSFSQVFYDETAYNNYFSSDEKDNDTKRVVEKGFFYYRIIDTIQSPFVIIKEKWNDLYDNNLYSINDTENYIDFAEVFVLGLKNLDGDVIFRGLREEFPNIPQADVDKLLYRFVLSYGRGKMENTADKTEKGIMLTSLIWERDNKTAADEIKLVTLKPNSVGWNVLALGLTALFAGILVLAAFLIKKNRPKITYIPPAPPKVPPSVFGDEYR